MSSKKLTDAVKVSLLRSKQGIPRKNMKRILCLHGTGTSAQILKIQLRGFIARADAVYEFEFLQGDIRCSPGKDVPHLFQGPYYSYAAGFTPASTQTACSLIDSFINAEGPFDGILGFSQGASLALTYLLHHQLTNPGEEPPFKFAILFSTALAFSPDETFCNDILDSLTDADIELLRIYPHCDLSTLSAEKRQFCETALKAFHGARKGGFFAEDMEVPFDFSKRSCVDQPRIYHPGIIRDRICIPTVHIYGKGDDPIMVEMSKLMTDLCDADNRRIVTHSGSHSIPTAEGEVRAVCSALDHAAHLHFH